MVDEKFPYEIRPEDIRALLKCSRTSIVVDRSSSGCARIVEEKTPPKAEDGRVRGHHARVEVVEFKIISLCGRPGIPVVDTFVQKVSEANM